MGCDTHSLALTEELSPKARDLLSHLLDLNSDKRYTIAEAKKHSFFEDIDFEALAEKKIPPPGMFLDHSVVVYIILETQILFTELFRVICNRYRRIEFNE